MKKSRTEKMMFAFLAMLLGLSVAAGAQGNYALLVQSSPPDAGTVSPGLGVHEIQVGQTVGLSATPRSGYRFAYWLGDVSSAGASDTTISIDSPKLVVAVFVREEFEEELPGVGVIKGQFNPGFQRYAPSQVGFPRAPSPGFDFNPQFPVRPNEPDDNGNDDIPVPGDDDIPVPGDEEIPEPATVFLLGLGGLLLRKRK